MTSALICRVQFVMIDTVVMAGQSQLADGSSLPGDKLPGPWDAKMAGEELQVSKCVVMLSNHPDSFH